MCELFAMSASQPMDVDHYLTHLMPRGGKTGPHADGWGVAYFEDRGSRIFKDAAPAADSRYLAMLAASRMKSTSVIAHIRKANPSVVGRATANTHPFEREWNGRSWVFAHNGKLPGLEGSNACADSRFQPVGGTDSELAFCYLLDVIARRFERADDIQPNLVIETIEPVVQELSGFGEFNFILGNGEYLVVHAHTNLHVLQHSLNSHHDTHTRALLATAPLTDEDWQALAPGTIRVYKDGIETGSSLNA